MKRAKELLGTLNWVAVGASLALTGVKAYIEIYGIILFRYDVMNPVFYAGAAAVAVTYIALAVISLIERCMRKKRAAQDKGEQYEA